MRIQWLGHAAVKLESENTVVYVDPSEMSYLGEAAKDLMARQGPADIILITHEHPDHCSPEVIKRLRGPNTAVVAPPACGRTLGSQFTEIRPADMMMFGPVGVRAVEAYNVVRHRSPGTPFHPRNTGVGYVITMDGYHIYHAGDTEPIPEMERFAPVDIALVPVDGHYTMSPSEALQSAALVGASTCIPIHYFDTTVDAVMEAARAVPGIRLETLELGSVFEPTH